MPLASSWKRRKETVMSNHQSCIEACNECANACDHCAIACLQEPDPKAMARCIALDIDCAQVCRLAVAFMARGSAHDSAACAFCATVCEACADECSHHQAEHCQACAEACRRCAEECRRMSQQPTRGGDRTTGTHAQH
jgi:hypothetical protein